MYEKSDENYKIASVFMDHYPRQDKKYLQDKLHNLLKGLHDNAVKNGKIIFQNYNKIV